MLDEDRKGKPMGAAANASQAYRSAEIQTISQRDLIVKLYQGAERFLASAIAAMNNRQPEQAHLNCQKAKAIFVELASTLDLERGGEVAQRLKSLYLFFITRTVEANLRKAPTLIQEILPLVASLREAWQQIPESEANRPAPIQGDGAGVFSIRT